MILFSSTQFILRAVADANPTAFTYIMKLSRALYGLWKWPSQTEFRIPFNFFAYYIFLLCTELYT